jgi:hypothetical protein
MIWRVRVVVPALQPSCVASLVLAAEGVDHDVCLVDGNEGYAELVAGLWERGEGFILVEHDVCPWVGAIQQLMDCENPWCSFYYAKDGGTIRALGCVKFSDRLVQFNPGLSEGWRGTHWLALDGTVLSAVASKVGVCVHRPALGHARPGG